MAKCLCRKCNKTFSTVAAFDKHRAGSYGEPIYKESSTGQSVKVVGHTKSERRCLTTEEMQAIGMAQNQKGWWITKVFEGWDSLKNEDAETDEDEELAEA